MSRFEQNRPLAVFSLLIGCFALIAGLVIGFFAIWDTAPGLMLLSSLILLVLGVQQLVFSALFVLPDRRHQGKRILRIMLILVGAVSLLLGIVTIVAGVRLLAG